MNDQAAALFQTLRRIQIQAKHLASDVLAGAYHSAFKGKGIEFEEVREYQPGDEIRSIDWNVTARMNHPFVKLFKEERELTVLLLVDVSFSCHFGQRNHLKSALIAEVGALLAFSAIKNNDKVGLILFSSRVEKYLPPAKGLRHVLRVIRDLLYFKPRQQDTDLAHALSFASKVHPRSCVCFVLSDFLAPSFEHEWSLAARRHDLIAVRVYSPYEEAFPPIGLATLRDLESGATATIDTSSSDVQSAVKEQAQHTFEKLKSLCQRTNTGLINLSTHQPPLDEIKKFFTRRSSQWR